MAASSGPATTGAAAQPGDTAGYTALGTSAAAGVLGAWAGYESGKTNRSIARYQASIAELQGRAAINRGTFEGNRIRTQTQKLIGTQQAGFAGQGVVVGKDTAGAVTAYTEAVGEADALAVKNNAFLESWGFEVSAASSRYAGEQAAREGTQRAIGSLLTTGANIGKFLDRADLGSGPAGYSNSATPSYRLSGPAAG